MFVEGRLVALQSNIGALVRAAATPLYSSGQASAGRTSLKCQYWMPLYWWRWMSLYWRGQFLTLLGELVVGASVLGSRRSCLSCRSANVAQPKFGLALIEALYLSIFLYGDAEVCVTVSQRSATNLGRVPISKKSTMHFGSPLKMRPREPSEIE